MNLLELTQGLFYHICEINLLDFIVSFSELTTISAIIGYTLACLLLFARLFHPKGPHSIAVLCSAVIGILGHAFLVSQTMFTQSDINFNLANVISLVSLIIVMLTTSLALKYKMHLLQPIVYGFSAIWLLIVWLFHPSADIPLQENTLIIISHVTIALVAYCILIIATLYSFQVSYIHTKLKNKNLTALNHLPPLLVVERQLFFILALGTIGLAVSELTGFIFLDNWFSKETAHKTVFSLMALALYCYIIVAHYKSGIRSQKTTILTTIATFLLTLSYFGSRFVKEFLLS